VDLDQIQVLSPGTFDLILSLESFHCFSNLPHLLDSVRNLLRPSAGMPQDDQRPFDHQSTGEFVIGDIFDKSQIPELESLFLRHGFNINKKEIITFNVKHAMQLDKPRVEKLIASISTSLVLRRFLKNFFSSAEGSRIWEELGKSKEYICYVLKPSHT
jgi:cyclopropane fatty-acyl-phospholipid synthase-like methyltransferase